MYAYIHNKMYCPKTEQPAEGAFLSTEFSVFFYSRHGRAEETERNLPQAFAGIPFFLAKDAASSGQRKEGSYAC